jgi:hypothetical protein
VNANLQGTSFINAAMAGVLLKQSRLQGANFENASLQGAAFQMVQLSGASFKRARLQGATFSEASGGTLIDFSEAYLWGTESVSCEKANLKDAHLEPTIGLLGTFNKLAPATPEGFDEWVAFGLARLPEALKTGLRERLHQRLIADQGASKPNAGEQFWRACIAGPKFADYDKERALYLIELSCAGTQNAR